MQFCINCYNTRMATILQYFVLILAGYLSGVGVNFIVEWFYLRRKFLSDDCEVEIQDLGWRRFLVWPFSSSSCPTAHKIRIILVEIIFVFLTMWLWISPPERVEFWWGFPVLIYFAIVVVMDVEYRVVLHPISLAGVVLGSIVGVYRHGLLITFVGGIIGFTIMYVLYKFGELFMRWVNRRRGDQIDEVALGFGDVNMAGVVGLFLGWPPIILGLLFAIFSGGGFSILFVIVSLFLRKFRAFAALPYAPFLALAALLMLFFPNEVALWITPLSSP